MIRQWFSQTADPSFAIYAFFFFFLVFLGALVWVYKKGPKSFSKQREMPLNDD